MSTNWKAKAVGVRTALMSNGALCALSWTPKSTDNGPLAVSPPAVAHSAWGMIDSFKPSEIGVQPDSLIQAGDVKLLLSVFTEPNMGHLPEPPNGALIVAPDGVTYKVANVEPLNPAGTVVMYTVALRR